LAYENFSGLIKISAGQSSGQPVEPAHLELGRRGEALAAAYLDQQGYAIVAANL